MDQIYDVAVIGAGPSGIAAAVYASRYGAKTALLEKDSVIGGTAFKAYVNTLNGLSLTAMDGLLSGITKKAWGSVIFSHEKLLDRYYSFLEKKDITILDGYEVISVNTEGADITSLICSSPSGKAVISAKIIIDASGTLAVETMTGKKDSGLPSYIYITGIIGKVEAVGGKCYSSEAQALLSEKISDAKEKGRLDKRLGIKVHPTVRADIAHISVSYDYTEKSVGSLMRAKIKEAVEFLQDFGFGYENASLISSSKELFTSAQGSFNAKYMLTLSDIEENRYFNDQVTALPDGDGVGERVYYIPYGSLLSKNYGNLLLCGRNIGAEANASRRMDAIPTHFETGKAAGIAASIAVKNDMMLDEVSAYEIKSKSESSVTDKIEVMNETLGLEEEDKAPAAVTDVPDTLDSDDIIKSISPAIGMKRRAGKTENFEELDKMLGLLGDDIFKSPVPAEADGADDFDVYNDLRLPEKETEAPPVGKSEVESLFDKLDSFSGIIEEDTPAEKAEKTEEYVSGPGGSEKEQNQVQEYSAPEPSIDFPAPMADEILPVSEEAPEAVKDEAASILDIVFESHSALSVQTDTPKEAKPSEEAEEPEPEYFFDEHEEEPVQEQAAPQQETETPVSSSVTMSDDVMSLLYDTELHIEPQKPEMKITPPKSIVQDELSVLYEDGEPEKKVSPSEPKKDMVSSMLEMIYDITEYEKSGGVPPIEPDAEAPEAPEEPEEEIKIDNYDKFKSIKDFLYDNDED